MNKSYHELRVLPTFEDRFHYLKLHDVVGRATFGFERYLNQTFYQSREWKQTRNGVIIRDDSCDLGIPDREIYGQLFVHHINPITIEDVETGADSIFDFDNLITTTFETHNAIHYGDISQLPQLPKVRSLHDTKLW